MDEAYLPERIATARSRMKNSDGPRTERYSLAIVFECAPRASDGKRKRGPRNKRKRTEGRNGGKHRKKKRKKRRQKTKKTQN